MVENEELNDIALAIIRAKTTLENIRIMNTPNTLEGRVKLEAERITALRQLAAAEKRKEAWINDPGTPSEN